MWTENDKNDRGPPFLFRQPDTTALRQSERKANSDQNKNSAQGIYLMSALIY